MNFTSKLRYLFPLPWILAYGLVPAMVKGSILCFTYSFTFFQLHFYCFSTFLSAIYGFPWVATLFSSQRGWGEVKVWEAAVQVMIFALFVGSWDRALSQRLLRWMVHSMADLFPLSSPTPGFLPNSFLWVQFPWHRKPLWPPFAPWNIHTPSSYKTLMVLAALLLLFLLALCRGSSYFSLKILFV